MVPILIQGRFITPDNVYGQAPDIQEEHATLTIGDIICFSADEYKENSSNYGYRDIQGNVMGVYAYRSKYLDIADGRLQSELTKDLGFRFTTACQKKMQRYPQHDFVLTIYDIDETEPLAPTPFGMHQKCMTQFYGLGQYYKNPPDYDRFPYSNTTIIINLHQYNRQAQFRGLAGQPELKAYNGWECAHYQWKERPVYRNKKERATDERFYGRTGPMQYELTTERADNIAQEIILQHLPTWLRRQYNVFIEFPVLEDYRVSEVVTVQPQFARIVQQLAHNG